MKWYGVVAVVVCANRLGAQSPDSTLLARARDAEIRYFDQWRSEWTGRFVDLRHRNWWLGERDGERDQVSYWMDTTEQHWIARVDLMWDAHCTSGLALPGAVSSYGDKYRNGPLRIIRSTASANAVCPAYARGPKGPLALAGRASVDSLRTMSAAVVKGTRLHAIALLDSAARAFPQDAWVVGQRIRMSLDSDASAEALTIARECRTNRWWCSALAGYVFAQRGNLVSADSAFGVAIAAVGGDARCQWTDVRGLLDARARREYERLSCARRDSVSTNLFWLADPAWDVPGNERRVEHFSRKVSLLVRSALERDEVYNWRPDQGGDAVAEMVMRYGWPTQRYWYGQAFDAGRERWLRSEGSSSSSPHTVPEYSRDRVHLVPTWTALVRPHNASAADWDMRPDTSIFNLPNPLSPLGVSAAKLNWWLPEHMRYESPIVQFGDTQAGAFCRIDDAGVQRVDLRRDDGILFAFATELAPMALQPATGDSVTGALTWSDRPDAISRVSHVRTKADARLMIRGIIPPRAGLIGVEVPSAGPSSPMVRTRFGYAPPSAYETVAKGGSAISQAVLIDAPTDGSPLSNDPEVVLDRMMGSTSLTAGTKQVGVYWETYGFTPGDSLELGVRIRRTTNTGIVERLGVALNLSDDRNAPVVVSWTEPDRGRARRVIGARVATLARSLTLDVSHLPAGEYVLELSAGAPRGKVVTSSRTFAIR